MSQPYPPQQYPQQPPGGYGYPPPPQQPQQPSAGLAIAALVLGIVALLLCWIPIVNYVAVVLGVVGLVLGIIGVFKSKRTMSIIGAALSFVAIVAAIIVVSVFADAVDEAVAELDTSISTGGTVEGGEESLDAEVEANADPAPGAETNSRGNIPKGLGEDGGIANADDVEVLTFAVDSITVDPACSSDWKEYGTPLEPGHHLVAVQLRVATTPLISEDDFLSVSGYDFKFIGADGITVDSLDSISTYGCLDDGQEFTSDLLGPGQMYAGAIVVDLPAASGTLVFDPSWGQSGGWEYGF